MPITAFFAPIEWIIGIIALIIILAYMRKYNRQSWIYLFCFSIFWLYVLALLNATVFPLPEYRFVNANERQFWTALTFSNINLIPFNYGEFSYFGYVFPEITSNIILTIPFGFGLSFIARFNGKDFFWIGLVLGLSIELTQLAIGLIYATSFRVVDINDVLLNTAGVWLGYFVFRIFSWLYLAAYNRFSIKRNWLSGFIYDITIQAQGTGRLKNA
jgi:glycopeptide antibiotics resistance protein